jgi:hypothetical protein
MKRQSIKLEVNVMRPTVPGSRFQWFVPVCCLIIVLPLFLQAEPAFARPGDFLWKVFAFLGDVLIDTGVGTILEQVGDLFFQKLIHLDPSIVQVVIDPNNLHQGIYPGLFKISGSNGGYPIECTVNRPILFRDSVDSADWRLSASAKDALSLCFHS